LPRLLSTFREATTGNTKHISAYHKAHNGRAIL
jgi:hypothetical protein